jgi:hypothetical protein
LNDLKIANHLLPLPALEVYQKLHLRLSRHGLTGLRARLTEVLHQPVEMTIIFPPSLDWSEQLFQRPQQLAAALARLCCRVLYFQHREHWEAEPFREIHPGLWLCSAPVEVFWELPVQGLYTYALTWNCRSALAPNIQDVIYDFVDQLDVFPGSQTRLMSDHKAFLRRARLVLASSDHLLAQAQTLRPDARLCPNAVDFEHFAKARQAQTLPPDDLKPYLSIGKPLAGYIGALARWVGYSLLEAVALERTDWQFVLIGPDHDQTLPARLLELPNLHWLGPKPYAQLPDYLRFFNAALIPFQLNPITMATSPLKLYEYLAAGKAVISTPIHEATRLPGILLAEDATAFSAQLDQARQLDQDTAYLAQSEQIARQNTWEMRAQLIINSLNQPARPGIIFP